jgi:hypothetical protein
LGGIPVERYGGLVSAETVYWGNFLVDLIDVHVPLLSLRGGRVETLSDPEGLGVLIGFSDRVRDIDPPDMPEGARIMSIAPIWRKGLSWGLSACSVEVRRVEGLPATGFRPLAVERSTLTAIPHDVDG